MTRGLPAKLTGNSQYEEGAHVTLRLRRTLQPSEDLKLIFVQRGVTRAEVSRTGISLASAQVSMLLISAMTFLSHIVQLTPQRHPLNPVEPVEA